MRRGPLPKWVQKLRREREDREDACDKAQTERVPAPKPRVSAALRRTA